MKKKILCCVLAAILAFPVSALAADDEQTELSGDQRKATIMVLSITGNEMTYVEIDNDLEDESEPDSEGMRELESEEIPEPESGADNEAPAGPGGDGQMPQMGGNMEDMIEAFQENGGQMPGGQDSGADGSESSGQAENGGGFGGVMSGATTVYLQVGLVVHADGKDKTFSILEAGDELEALFETDDERNEVITEMWLLDS